MRTHREPRATEPSTAPDGGNAEISPSESPFTLDEADSADWQTFRSLIGILEDAPRDISVEHDSYLSVEHDSYLDDAPHG